MLSRETLAEIWNLADITVPKGQLDVDEFFVALKLIALAQCKLPVSRASLSTRCALPSLEGTFGMVRVRVFVAWLSAHCRPTAGVCCVTCCSMWTWALSCCVFRLPLLFPVLFPLLYRFRFRILFLFVLLFALLLPLILILVLILSLSLFRAFALSRFRSFALSLFLLRGSA